MEEGQKKEEISKRYGGSAEVCRVLAEMVEIMDEHYDRRDEHYSRREKMLEIIMRRMHVGLIMIALTSLMLGALLYKLIDNIADDMEIIAQQMVTMQHTVGGMQVEIQRVADDVNIVTRSVGTIADNMIALPPMQLSISQMAQTMALIQQDTGSMRQGMFSMTQDTHSMSTPFRMMPFGW